MNKLENALHEVEIEDRCRILDKIYENIEHNLGPVEAMAWKYGHISVKRRFEAEFPEVVAECDAALAKLWRKIKKVWVEERPEEYYKVRYAAIEQNISDLNAMTWLYGGLSINRRLAEGDAGLMKLYDDALEMWWPKIEEAVGNFTKENAE